MVEGVFSEESLISIGSVDVSFVVGLDIVAFFELVELDVTATCVVMVGCVCDSEDVEVAPGVALGLATVGVVVALFGPERRGDLPGRVVPVVKVTSFCLAKKSVVLFAAFRPWYLLNPA